MVFRSRIVDPPPGSRKVPRFKLWLTADGTPYGPYGRKSARTSNKASKALTISATDEAGREFNVSLAQMMALAWLPPRPPNAKLVHLDGDLANNAAANLVWAPKKKSGQRGKDWKERALPKMKADPEDPRHGTRTGYAIGCRCQECRNAAMVYRRMLQTRKLIRQVESKCMRTEQ